MPVPFVAPPLLLHSTDSAGAPLAVEVIFIEAPAAVGKSTLANCLSASFNIPVLDLGRVRVSVGSLPGIITGDFTNAAQAQAAFHRGELPMIVDALDEGQMFSGEQHIEEFLETAFEFINQDRSVTTRPKLVFFGRPEAHALAATWCEVCGDGITRAHLSVDYFDEQAARQLIDANARLVADTDADAGSAYLSNPGPVREVVDAYFRAIESALGVAPGNLWSEEVGRAFAGYAPVLAALGHLLAGIRNFSEVVSRLGATGSREAWQVIEAVVSTILEREQIEKFRPSLSERLGSAPPPEAYDASEQIRFLAYYIDGQQPTSSGRVPLAGNDLATYLSMAGDKMLDHPFIRQGKIANSVLASFVLADGVANDRFRNGGMNVLASESRQPFLWQALRPKLVEGQCLLDGRYVGYILDSFWSDPLIRNPKVRVLDGYSDATARVEMAEGAKVVEFEAMFPVAFFRQMRGSEIRVAGSVRFDGDPSGQGTAFRIHGNRSTVIAGQVEVVAETVILEGEVWLEASQLSAPARVTVLPKKGSKVGWGGVFASTYPWNAHTATLAPPDPPQTYLSWLLLECQSRFADGQAIVLYDDYTPVEDDPHTRWAANAAGEFAAMIDLMVKYGLASKTFRPAGGPRRKINVHPRKRWSELVAANADPATASSDIAAWLAEAQDRIH